MFDVALNIQANLQVRKLNTSFRKLFTMACHVNTRALLTRANTDLGYIAIN